MPQCMSRSCTHCNPPGREERQVLREAIERIEQAISTDDVWDSHTGERYVSHRLDWHPDFYESWFLPLANAYEAGMRAAMREVQDVLAQFEGKGH